MNFSVDKLNIFLMLAACLISLYAPFDLLLISYAFLGPAHYLTEISWLNEKKYFTGNKTGILLIFILGAISIITFRTYYFPFFICLGFCVPIVFEKSNFDTKKIPLICFIIVAGVILTFMEGFQLIFGLYLPTLIHVYVFTGAFILLGALKTKSAMAFLSLIIFFICPLVLFLFFTNSPIVISNWAKTNYLVSFAGLNGSLITKLNDITVFSDKSSVAATRFISFAYTYHYLNWFSKINVIKWGRISKKRLFLLVLIWSLSISLYIYNFKTGLHILFTLSLIHVILEFPLNHKTFKLIRLELLNKKNKDTTR